MATKSASRKSSTPKSTAKKTTAKKAAKASGTPKTKAAAAQTAKTKTAPKKAAVKKPAAKKAAAKKPAAKKVVAKKVVAKKAAPKVTAKKTAAKAAQPKPAAKAPVAKKSASSTAKKAVKKVAAKVVQKAPPQKLPRQKDGFKIKDHVVYPTHGVGLITDIEEREVAGMPLQLFVIEFEQEKMTLRVPLAKAKATGMRQLSSKDTVKVALQTLRGRARIKRTMWSRRAQEYEAKINSGDLISIAEVVRDLHRAEGQPEQSYSERQLYEAALDRLSRELAAVERIAHDQAVTHVEKVLSKAA